MTASEKIPIICRVAVADPQLKRALAEVSGLSGIAIVGPDAESDLQIDDLGAKTRIGAVVDWILLRARDARAQYPKSIHMYAGRFEPASGIYHSPRGDEVRLTMRERDLILYLFQGQERSRSRADILQNVWGYVSGLETHTLETHVYRLRQKIEIDPGNPQALLTVEGGYQLQVEKVVD